MFKSNFHILILISLILLTAISCNSSNTKVKQIPDTSDVMSKDHKLDPFTNYDWPLVKKTDAAADNVSVPFYEDMRYYITDSNGKQISSNRYDGIHFDSEHPFYWIKKSDKYYLYTFPEAQVIAEGFDKPQKIEFARSRLNVSKNIVSPFIYYTLKNKIAGDGFQPWYFFTRESRNIKISNYAPLTWASEMGCSNLKSSYQSTNAKYLIVLDEDCKMRFIDQNAKSIGKNSFTEFENFRTTENYIKVKEGKSTQQVFDYPNKTFTSFPYKNLKHIEGLNGYFTGRDLDDEKYNEKLVIDHTGDIVYAYTNGKDKLSEGLLFRKVNDNYELFDVLKKEIVVKIPQEKHGYIKNIKSYQNKYYLITHDDRIFSPEGKQFEIAPWQTRPKGERDSLLLKIKANFSDQRNVQMSACIFDKYYLVTIDDVQGLFYADGTKAIDYDNIKIIALNSDQFVWKGINIYKGSQQIQLNENLELTRFPNTEILRRAKIDFDQIGIPNKSKHSFKWVNSDHFRNGYLIFQDDSYVYVFDTDGNYLSSHQGRYSNTVSNFSLLGIVNDEPYYSNFVELFHSSSKGNENPKYYVNLKTGREYLKE